MFFAAIKCVASTVTVCDDRSYTFVQQSKISY